MTIFEQVMMVLLMVLFICVVSYLLSPKKKKGPSPKQLEENKRQQEQYERDLHDDGQRVTNNDIRNLIIELQLPSTILELFDGKCTDAVIVRNGMNDYADPYRIISLLKHQQDYYKIDRYKPLLAYGGGSIFAYDTVSGGFVEYDVEYFREENLQRLTWDGLFVGEILRWWEYEIPDNDILYIGKLFGLKHTGQILNSIVSLTGGKGFADFDAAKAWKQQMLVEINGYNV